MPKRWDEAMIGMLNELRKPEKKVNSPKKRTKTKKKKVKQDEFKGPHARKWPSVISSSPKPEDRD